MFFRISCRAILFFSLLGIGIFFPALAQVKRETVVKQQWEQFSKLALAPGANHFGLQKQDKWVSTRISNSTNEPATYFIRFHNPHLNEIEGYRNLSTTSFVLTGDWFSFSQRPLPFRDFLISVTVPPNSTDSLLFRLNKRGESLSLQYELIPEKDLLAEMNQDYLWLGLVISFVLLVAAIAFFMGINFKDPLYFIFFLYSLLALGWLLNNTGVFFQVAWPTNILWHYKSRTFFSVASISVYLLFLYQFFGSRIKAVDRVLFISFTIFLALKLYGVLIAPQVEYKLNRKYIFVLVSGLGLAFFLIYLIYFFVRNFWQSKPHRFHLAAFILYTFLILNEAILQFGISFLPFLPYSDYIPFVFFLLQLLFMVIGLSVQINLRLKKIRLQELFQVREDERAVSSQQLQILESERKRIGRDIHDQLGGLLVSIKLNLSNLKLKFLEQPLHKELDRIRILVDSSINQLHQVVHDLAPPIVTAENFNQLVNERIRLYEEVSSIHFTVDLQMSSDTPQSLLTHLYRIICELISNSVQHSQCSAVQISCLLQDSALILKYSDNGQGFVSENKKEGRGIRNIEDRVALLHGRVEFTSDENGMICNIEFVLN